MRPGETRVVTTYYDPNSFYFWPRKSCEFMTSIPQIVFNYGPNSREPEKWPYGDPSENYRAVIAINMAEYNNPSVDYIGITSLIFDLLPGRQDLDGTNRYLKYIVTQKKDGNVTLKIDFKGQGQNGQGVFCVSVDGYRPINEPSECQNH